MEVTCNPNLREADNTWNIEDNVYPKLPNSSFEIYAPSFLSKFLEAHTVMFQGNAGLKPKEGEVTSQPWQWPINYRGQWFSAIDGYKVYLLGNPVIWWGNIVIMAAFIGVYGINKFLEKRGKLSLSQQDRRTVALQSCCWLLLAWALHYLPFYFMGRILYYHHYFPALLFSSMLTGKTTSCILYYHHYFPALFYLFAPLSYGMHEVNVDRSNSSLQHLRWVNSWEF
ncbi:protein O-mannosyl-transferase 2-like [Hyalella azteca]|uniref:Protein O-mannosyl-transferase 2-like n=1 Tax=Hyalella azteca TaxID=294128 RepID=A0A979FSL0_HYAAZ|nr:protein O-mannosyl-transferase 2-like [Hyalella azteca]